MVKRNVAKRLQKRARDNTKILTVAFLLIGLIVTFYIGSNGRHLSAFMSGGAAPFIGDVSFAGMSVEGETQTFDKVSQFSLNFDGLPAWVYYNQYAGDEPPAVQTEDYSGLDGAPACMPTTSWAFGSIYHIDLDTTNPQIIADNFQPSGYQIADGIYYTELYRYSTNIYVRVHADMPEVGMSAYSLVFADAQSNSYASHYIGEISPMREIYAKVGVSIDAINTSIINTGADMAANGMPEIRFWRWSSNPTWDATRSYNLADTTQLIKDEIAVGVRINRDIMQTGFDIAQGFNPVAKVEGRNSYYEFNVGFNFLGVPGYYYNYYKDLLFFQENMQLFDIEIRIPVTIMSVITYNLPAEAVNAFIELNPELGVSGATLTVVGNGSLPTDDTYGKYYPDNTVLNVIEGLPGFSWFQGQFGIYAAVAMIGVIGLAAGYLVFGRRQ